MCRSRRELSNEYLLAKIGVDTAENEPLEVWGKIQFNSHLPPYWGRISDAEQFDFQLPECASLGPRRVGKIYQVTPAGLGPAFATTTHDHAFTTTVFAKLCPVRIWGRFSSCATCEPRARHGPLLTTLRHAASPHTTPAQLQKNARRPGILTQ